MATVIDIAYRRVVGFALADHLRTELVADALANAVAARDPEPGRSSTPTAAAQYTSAAYAAPADNPRSSSTIRPARVGRRLGSD